MIYVSPKRFDCSTADFTSRGFDFELIVDGEAFQVRLYFDQPEDLAIIKQKAARQSPKVRQLVDYLVSVLGGRRICFYNERSQTYQEINTSTLKFIGRKKSVGCIYPQKNARHGCVSDSDPKVVQLVSA